MLSIRTDESNFLHLAREANLNEETAYTICRMIDSVGWKIKEEWDWNWLEKITGNFRCHIDQKLVVPAWHVLVQKEWFSLQTVQDDMPRVSTVKPLEDMKNLRSLILQNNHISDLQALTGLSRLRHLNFHANRVSDLAPLASVQSLEELHIGSNPIASMAALDNLPKLRTLFITADQFPALMTCKLLPSLQYLRIEGEGALENVVHLPEMPCLKILDISGLKDTTGLDRFASLSTLTLSNAQFSDLERISVLKNLTHFEIWTSGIVNLQPLSALAALRSVKVLAPHVTDVPALMRLPVLHEVRFDHDTQCDQGAFEALCNGLSPWATEFVTTEKKVGPSFDIEIVSQETFDLHDSKESFGIHPGECEDGMFHSERTWLQSELTDVLTTRFKEGVEQDLLLPGNSGHRRSERLVLYSLAAYESCREIILSVQEVLCQVHNDWIIYFQSCLGEGPDCDGLPEDAEDFIVWIYPGKIIATEENAAIIRKLIGWD